MNVNRIFCIGKNYAEHVAELAHLGHSTDGQCVVFMKPASCIVPPGQPVPLPRGKGSLHHEAEVVIRLGGGGADIAVDQALRHVTHITLGLDLTLRDLQTTLKNQGKPWELAKAFDGAAPLGAWTAYAGQDLSALEFSCAVNGQLRQAGNTRDLLFPVNRIIHILSQTWSLQDGDVIFTGTPAGVGPLLPGDRISVQGASLGSFEWSCV